MAPPGWRVGALLPTAVGSLVRRLRSCPRWYGCCWRCAEDASAQIVIAVLSLVGTLVVGEYLAGALIAVMLAGGRALDAAAERRATRDLRALLERAPRFARRRRGTEISLIPLAAVAVNDILAVGPGEVVPVDGRVADTVAVLDESVLTGESQQVERAVGESVRSGVVNAGNAFELRATATADQSTYAGIVKMAQRAGAENAPIVRLADRYAAWFLPLALLVAGAAWFASGSAVRAVAVLVVATPCPLLLAAPVAIVSGLSRASRAGVVIRGGAALETLGRAETLVMDKTGTLTMGRPAVIDVIAAPGRDAPEVLRLAASVDQLSPHVLAEAIVTEALNRGSQLSIPTNVVEEPGRGVTASIDGRPVTGRKVAGRRRDIRVGGSCRQSGPLGQRRDRLGLRRQRAGRCDLIAGPLAPARTANRAPVARGRTDSVDPAHRGQSRTNPGGRQHLGTRRRLCGTDAGRQIRRRARRGTTGGDGDGGRWDQRRSRIGGCQRRGGDGCTRGHRILGGRRHRFETDRLDRLADAMDIARWSRRIAIQSAVAGMGLSLLAMAIAALGYLPPALGALLQEGIDVAVILNALRALRGDPATEVHLAAGTEEMLHRFAAEHDQLRDTIGLLRDTANRLAADPDAAALESLNAVHTLLTDRIVPHELAEETQLYPALARPLGSGEATAAMSRTHAEIQRLADRIATHLALAQAAGEIQRDQVNDLLACLYGLYALLRLHFVQEEESYFTLAEDDVDHDQTGCSQPHPDTVSKAV